MPKPVGFTDKMFWRMCDCHMSNPIPLEQADLTRPFVYERRWGLFYVPGCSHPMAMSLLLAWQHDCDSPVDVADKLGLRLSDETAEHWLLHTPGAAFRSSVSPNIQVGSLKNLSVHERRLFGDALRVLD